MTDFAKIEQLYFDSDVITVESQAYPEKYPLHWHQFVECLAILQEDSSAIVSINQRPMTIHTGDFLLIWPGELHEIIDNSSKCIVALQFPLSLIDSKKEFAACYELFKDNCFLQYKLSPELNLSILKSFNQIISIRKENADSFTNVKMTICLYEMIINIALSLKNTKKPPMGTIGRSETLSDKISIACAYIKSHCTEDLSLEAVASSVGFSPCYFSRHFKQITTHSFVEYLILQRINRFQILLSDKSLSITDAAFQAGFRSVSTVNRVFYKYCGCTPSEFRKMGDGH